MTTVEILKLKHQKVEELQNSLNNAQTEEDREFLYKALRAWKSLP